MLSSSDCSKLS